MKSPLWATAALFTFCPVASASLARPRAVDSLTLPREARPWVTSLPKPTVDVPPPPQADLAADSEVVLNGRRCEFKDVPATATVTRVVLAADGKTIVRIEFSTGK